MDSVQRVVILPHEPIGVINPYLHGHFAEHLGELIYPGVWVGSNSSIPNTLGIRNDIVAALKPLGVPVLRWPGGCFADNYHWRDGIGPAENRPKRVNVHWGMAEETNHFGTHELMALCQSLGAEPYFVGNVGSGSPAELRDWIEYCNFSGSSTLANERRANGANEAFGIKIWGIGNENWGCGGQMSPSEYAEAFARYRSYAYNYPGARLEAVACGPNGNDWTWTRDFLDTLATRSSKNRLANVQGFGAHYYCGTAGTATEYTEGQWLELLSRAYAMEGIITGHRAIMDEYDAERKTGLIIDEWGSWHPVEKGKPGGGLYQQNTIRDACAAALTLDVFHNHADQLYMANLAQLINVLQALLLVEDDKCIKTPTYHVFDLYRPHKGAQAVRLLSVAETVSEGEASKELCRANYLDKRPFSLQALHGSASLSGDRLCVTLVNTHPSQPVELDLELHQGKLDEVEVVTLAAGDIHAHNTFDNPETVKLSEPQRHRMRGNRLPVPLAAASVTRIVGRIA